MTKRNRKSPAFVEQEVFKPFQPTRYYDVYCFEDGYDKIYYRIAQPHPYWMPDVARNDGDGEWLRIQYRDLAHLRDALRSNRIKYRLTLVAKNVRFNK